MADRKISDLTALTTPASGDYLPIVDVSEVAAASKNKRITIEELMRGAPDGTAAAPSIAFESDPNTGIYSPGADQVAISTNGTGRLFVDASGNIDLSWGTPRLASIFDNDFRQGLAFNTANRELKIFSTTNDNGGSIAFYTRNGAGASATDYGIERMRLDSSGSLGLGTSSPATLLDISVTGGMARIGGASGNNLVQAYTGASGLGMWAGGSTRLYSSANITFSTNATIGTGTPTGYVDAMTIDSSGNVGLGTSSPSSLLHLADAGNITVGTTTGTKIGTATTQKISLWNATPVVQPAAVANITTTATAGALPTPDGAVTIANTATPTVTELLEYCVELEAKLEDLLGKLRTVGIIAT
jgi:hypothetical protein